MVAPRVIRSVLHNFLGTYTSRYSDYNGYWLFGFMVAGLDELQINLTAPAAGDSDSPGDAAVRIAVANCAEQVHKAGLTHSQVGSACLTIRRLPTMISRPVNLRLRAGYEVSFLAEATAAGRHYRSEQVLFVAPHDAKVERRTARKSTLGSER